MVGKEVVEQKFRNISTFLATQAGLGGEYAEKLCGQCGVDPKSEQLTMQDAQKIYDNYGVLFDSLKKQDMSAELQKNWEQDQKKAAPKDKKLEKLNAILESQKASIEALSVQATQNNKKGELIYAHYQQLKDLLEKARKTRDLNDLLQEPLVASVDKKNKKITLEIDDEM